ncbi:hypothetical protein QQ020_30690 [Fulvivirgaceae bacterium BMA12]|uniref:WD40-like Beta Propeller Repeat n=1 Tax=Agaribacillus aureus TaxID=3051825 RepID=A0ABT8LHH0_9BACT|nr:hypothetical protein [Fulvivirgaceae bacterium BMA12]
MRYFLFLVIAILFISCQKKTREKAPAEATLWGAGKISIEAPEFATTVNADQNEVYFNRTSADRSTMQIMHATYANNSWSDAVSLSFSSGLYRDVDPFLTADGKRLYFSSNRPKKEGDEAGDFDTWFVEKINGKWSAPINPGAPLNSDSTEIFVTIAKNGNAYFVSERDGDRGIVVSRFENNRYQAVEKIPLKLRASAIYASNPCIASDESFLIVAARDPAGNGTPDLFVSWNVNGTWSELKNLGEKVNSPYADFAPGLSKDDQTLFFSSERPGIVPGQNEGVRPPGDIYKVHLEAILSELR